MDIRLRVFALLCFGVLACGGDTADREDEDPPVGYLGIACVDRKIEVTFDGEPRDLDIQFSQQFQFRGGREVSQAVIEAIVGPPETFPAEYQRHGKTVIIDPLFATYPNHRVTIEISYDAREPLILPYPCNTDCGKNLMKAH